MSGHGNKAACDFGVLLSVAESPVIDFDSRFRMAAEYRIKKNRTPLTTHLLIWFESLFRLPDCIVSFRGFSIISQNQQEF